MFFFLIKTFRIPSFFQQANFLTLKISPNILPYNNPPIINLTNMGNTKSKVKRVLLCSAKNENEFSECIGSKLPEPRYSNEESKDDEMVIEDIEKDLRYYLSNHSDSDIDRQHSNHFLRRFVYQSNYSAPVEEKLVQGCKVLDVGCGPGTWLLDQANKFQNSSFYGVDIKPVYPREIKPGNLQFGGANILDGLPFPDNEFDFTHQEIMSLNIGAAQWDRVVSELVRVTKPGGFIEVAEYVSPNNNGPVLEGIYKRHEDLCSLRGINVNLIPSLDKVMESHEHIRNAYKDERTVIIGPNGGQIGMVIQDIITTFHASELALEEISHIQGISKEELKNILVKEFHNELKETQPELNICRFWAKIEKKDEEKEESYIEKDIYKDEDVEII